MLRLRLKPMEEAIRHPVWRTIHLPYYLKIGMRNGMAVQEVEKALARSLRAEESTWGILERDGTEIAIVRPPGVARRCYLSRPAEIGAWELFNAVTGRTPVVQYERPNKDWN